MTLCSSASVDRFDLTRWMVYAPWVQEIRLDHRTRPGRLSLNIHHTLRTIKDRDSTPLLPALKRLGYSLHATGGMFISINAAYNLLDHISLLTHISAGLLEELDFQADLVNTQFGDFFVEDIIRSSLEETIRINPRIRYIRMGYSLSDPCIPRLPTLWAEFTSLAHLRNLNLTVQYSPANLIAAAIISTKLASVSIDFVATNGGFQVHAYTLLELEEQINDRVSLPLQRLEICDRSGDFSFAPWLDHLSGRGHLMEFDMSMEGESPIANSSDLDYISAWRGLARRIVAIGSKLKTINLRCSYYSFDMSPVPTEFLTTLVPALPNLLNLQSRTSIYDVDSESVVLAALSQPTLDNFLVNLLAAEKSKNNPLQKLYLYDSASFSLKALENVALHAPALQTLYLSGMDMSLEYRSFPSSPLLAKSPGYSSLKKLSLPWPRELQAFPAAKIRQIALLIDTLFPELETCDLGIQADQNPDAATFRLLVKDFRTFRQHAESIEASSQTSL
ncbi:hypothetical protein FA15DRAFT_668522 [Coprinopsis marcescibilis]|uniref:Uncharacterized protein n=1 Tax=Coprinopsis marcescibilis TaxID=230819 RepID=A0A5C3KYT1_COPMA|nr:hypothetical protein FA15DRAFT_668522 [Coprinopsis marcescibilis]